MDREAWRAAVPGVAKSQTQLITDLTELIRTGWREVWCLSLQAVYYCMEADCEDLHIRERFGIYPKGNRKLSEVTCFIFRHYGNMIFCSKPL